MSSAKESVLERFALFREQGYGLKQEDYIYDVYWSKKADKFFIEDLLDQQAAGKFNPRDLDDDALEFSMDSVNRELKTDFGLDCCYDRLEMLERHHNVFSWIVRKYAVKYRVYAALNVWDELVKWDDFTTAYMEFGDPEWVSLQILFRRPTSPVAPNVKFIHISDDEGPKNETINVEYDEEVKPDPGSGKMKKDIPISSTKSKKSKSPWSSKSRSFWKYLEELDNLVSLTSEPSINQPTPVKNSSHVPVNTNGRSASNFPVPRKLFNPSSTETISTAASSCRKK